MTRMTQSDFFPVYQPQVGSGLLFIQHTCNQILLNQVSCIVAAAGATITVPSLSAALNPFSPLDANNDMWETSIFTRRQL